MGTRKQWEPQERLWYRSELREAPADFKWPACNRQSGGTLAHVIWERTDDEFMISPRLTEPLLRNGKR